MGRIINKQTVLYLVLVITVAIFAGLAFIIWHDSKSLNQTDVRQEKIATTNKEARRQKGKGTNSGKLESNVIASKAKPKSSAKRRKSIRNTKQRIIQGRQVDTQKTLPKIKYEELFEKAEDLEIKDDEKIIQTGE